MSRPRRVWFIGVLCFVCGCEQLGNPPQFATGPTQWKGEQGHLVTTTRSFRYEKTIRRLVSEGLGELDHADASIGPSQTLTIVSVVPRGLSQRRHRAYRKALAHNIAISEIDRCGGSQFDPELAHGFLESIDLFREEGRSLEEFPDVRETQSGLMAPRR